MMPMTTENQFNIIVATDYSKAVRSAERYAVQFAQATGSTLRFVHVFEPALASTSLAFDQDKIAYNPLEYEFAKLNQHVNLLLESLGVKPGDLNCQCIIREGNSIRKQVLSEALETSADLIITGTHGAGEWNSSLFGSHSWKIISHAKIPVLVIPENTVFSAIKRIVFATGYHGSDFDGIKFITSIARKFDAEITVLHVANFVMSKEFENRLFENFKKEIKEKVSYDKLNIHLKHHYSIIDGLNDYCRLKHVDWLVMSPQKLRLIDKILDPGELSTTRHMSTHTQVPLFALPELSGML